MKNPFLIGTKIYLRPLEREDAPTVVPWFNDPQVARTLARHLPMNVRAEEEFIAKLYQNDELIALGIAVCANDRLIGCTGLHAINHKDRHAAFGIIIGVKEEWGKGYGTETTALVVRYAFQRLNLNRVWLHVYEDNQRAQRAYEKVGFKREGVLRQDNFREGRYRNTIVMGILRDESETVPLA